MKQQRRSNIRQTYYPNRRARRSRCNSASYATDVSLPKWRHYCCVAAVIKCSYVILAMTLLSAAQITRVIVKQMSQTRRRNALEFHTCRWFITGTDDAAALSIAPTPITRRTSNTNVLPCLHRNDTQIIIWNP